MLTHLNTVRSVTIGGRLSRHIQRPASHPAHPRSSSSNATRSHANTGFAEKRHTAAYRMARDPLVPLTDVQWVLGHAHLSTTQIYLTPVPDDVIAGMLAHHRRDEQDAKCSASPEPDDTGGYRSAALDVLFGRSR